jgi:F-type H+-transporting ATPase subunit delta
MELVTIAKPYANAIFAIAQQDKSFDDWRLVLDAAAVLVLDAHLQTYLNAPNVSKSDKGKNLQKLVAKVINRDLKAKENQFLSLILDNNRASILPSVLTLFDTRMNAFDDFKMFKVSSAYPLSEVEEKNIVAELSAKYDTKASIETTIDENLVGGLIIKLGDKVIDMSIKARIDELNLRLSTH